MASVDSVLLSFLSGTGKVLGSTGNGVVSVGRPVFNFTLSSFRVIILCFWLVLLFYLNLTVILLSLTAHQMHHKTGLVEINGSKITISQVRDFFELEEELEEWVDRSADYFKNQSDALDKFSEQIRKKKSDIVNAEPEDRAFLDGQLKLLQREKEITYECNFNAAKNDVNWKANKWAELRNVEIILNGFAAEHHELKPKKDRLKFPLSTTDRCIAIDYDEPDDHINIHPTVQSIIEDIKFFDELKTIDAKSRTNLGDQTSTSQGVMQKITLRWKNIISWLAKWLQIWQIIDFSDRPMEMLTIIVVLSMGMLGGTIRLATQFLMRKNGENLAIYIFYPLLGAVTAFAVYVLAKAGVLIISDADGGTKGALSPYFISFIGLVSGMLADNALSTIRRLGLRWFKDSEVEKNRYWVGASILETVEITPRELPNGLVDNATLQLKEMVVNQLNISNKIVENWLNGTVLVPSDAQKIISSWIRAPRRELFSDLPPPSAETIVENLALVTG